MEQHAPLIAQLKQHGYRDRWIAEPQGLRALGANRLVAPEDLVIDRQWGQGRRSLFALRDPVDGLRGFFTAGHESSQRDAAMVARLEREDRATSATASGVQRAAPIDPRDERIAQLEAALAEQNDKLREAVALYEHARTEFPAAKRRVEREAKSELDTWKGSFLIGFLEVMDDVDRALNAARGPTVAPAVAEGLELVASQFLAKLREQGVEPLARQERFDPELHDALATTPVAQPEDDGTIIEVVAQGYRRHDKVLRPTRVVVGKLGGPRALG